MKSYGFLFWAYNVVWILLAGYLFHLATRLKRIGRRIDRIESDLGDGRRD